MDGWKGEGGREGTDAARKRAARTVKEVCELRDVRNFSDAERHRVFVAPLAPLNPPYLHRAGTAANLLISTAVNALEYCCSFSQQNKGDRHIGEPGSKHRPLRKSPRHGSSLLRRFHGQLFGKIKGALLFKLRLG